jgi:hypothetical protein
MACVRCNDLMQTVQVQSPGDLEMVLRVVQANLRDGTIAPEPLPTSLLAPADVATLPLQGPWPDVIRAAFRCTQCGERFELSVETYHGAGGRWQPRTLLPTPSR